MPCNNRYTFQDKKETIMTTQRMQQKAELKTENSVLLDKIALYNFTIESVDDMEPCKSSGTQQ